MPSTSADTWPTKSIYVISLEHMQFILRMIFLMCVVTIKHLDYSRQETKEESNKNNKRSDY